MGIDRYNFEARPNDCPDTVWNQAAAQFSLMMQLIELRAKNMMLQDMKLYERTLTTQIRDQ